MPLTIERGATFRATFVAEESAHVYSGADSDDDHDPEDMGEWMDRNPALLPPASRVDARTALEAAPDYIAPGAEGSLSEILGRWSSLFVSRLEVDGCTITAMPGAREFATFMGRLDMATPARDLHFRAFITDWLERVISEPSLREAVFESAATSLNSCNDSVLLAFNAMQNAQVEHDITTGHYGQDVPVLINCLRRNFRVACIEHIAKVKTAALFERAHSEAAEPLAGLAFMPDGIEVQLHYQINLVRALDLDFVVKSMFELVISRVDENDIARAEKEIKTKENAEFSDWMIDSPAWHAALQYLDPQGYADAQQKLLDDIDPDGPIRQWIAHETARLSAGSSDRALLADIERNAAKGYTDRVLHDAYRDLTGRFLARENMTHLLNSHW